jgi:filamentous hemagglutinin family protein
MIYRFHKDVMLHRDKIDGMMNTFISCVRLVKTMIVSWAVCCLCQFQGQANPTGGTVSQGSASISGIGSSSVTINQTSANAFINWQSFDIGAGETTTFNQPSSSSVTWNYISDPNASALNGNLNANGYVILQNPNGFTVGGSAAIKTGGLVMTTASTPNLDLSGGGAWAFDAPPPTAKIINYGQINIAGGGSAYLIAGDIENNGTISAPNGKIGLYAGQQVLVSMSPDGRGLSAQVTLPQGSVNNQGQLIANAGSIVAQAQTVNQDGLIQANSVQDVNGTIELVASGNLNLGNSSQINANGDSTASSASSGGFVVLNAGNNTFADQSGSTISASGANGGQNGITEIFGKGTTASSVNSTVDGLSATAFLQQQPYNLFINPYDVTFSSAATATSLDAKNNLDVNFNISSLAGSYSQIDLQSLDNITLSSAWTLAGSANPATLNLTAENNITLNNSLAAGNNWNVNLTAGTSLLGTTTTSGDDGIYLNGTAYLQTFNGDINLDAANEVIVGSGAIRTIGGGNIDVTAEYGNVNSGTSTAGYNYYALGTGTAAKPYYTPFQLNGSGTSQTINFNQSNLGGISTAAGGNVTINAGANVISFPTTTVAAGDPGIGAFGPELGNVTINAGGSVYGNFVEGNGTGTINAGQNIGIAPSKNNPNITEQDVALSLVTGSWNLDAQDNIYLQEVRNPNGVFNNTTMGLGSNKKNSAGYHLFDYAPDDSVSLTAGNEVDLTGYELPRPNGAVPMLLPPTLIINAGSGGVTLQTPNAFDANGNSVTLSDFDITLFPSAVGNLQITTTDGGGLSSGNANGSAATLLMSDSGQMQWSAAGSGPQPFGETDNASVPVELGNTDPVVLNISGNMENMILQVCKLADVTVDGNMIGCSFYGENLNVGDVTTINVPNGEIYNASSFNQITLAQNFPSVPSADLPPSAINSWYLPLELAVNPALLPTQSLLSVPPSQLAGYLNNAFQFSSLLINSVAYDSNTKTLTAIGSLSSSLLTALESPTLTLVRYGLDGYPVLDANGHFVTDTITWTPANSANAAAISSLAAASQGAPPLGVGNGAYVVGGTGEFNITADSINLGNSAGILSVGNGNLLGVNYSFLTPYITSGATINVVADYLEMPGSTIASFGGGDVNVTCNDVIPGSTVNGSGVGVSMDLGSQELLPFEAQIMADSNIGLGIYTSGGGNVKLIALGTINIDSSRVATLDGGDVNITSLTGDVNAGSGGAIAIPVNSFSPNYSFPYEPVEYVYANGIVADTLAPLADGSLAPGAATLPGNITVYTPQGSIYASLGGILQETLNGTLLPGPTITLEAGTPNPSDDWNSTLPPLYGPPPGVDDNGVGDISLGNSGVIGGTIIVHATGKVSGLLIASQSINVNAGSLGPVTGFGPVIQVSSGGPSTGPVTLIGKSIDYNATGPADLLGQNVSDNGATAQSTLGNSASATSTSQSAAVAASGETTNQVASASAGEEKTKPQIRKVGRVTVILSAAVPAR